MALTQVKTLGIADDAVTEAKVANDAISPTEMKAGTDGHIITYDASGNPTTIGPGTDGQVLTSTGAGSPPAFEAIPAAGISDVVSDTTPQLGGDLDANGSEILLDDGDKVKFGNLSGGDLTVYHNGSTAGVIDCITGNLNLNATSGTIVSYAGSEHSIFVNSNEYAIRAIGNGGVKIYHDGTEQCSTSANGLAFPSGKGIDFSAQGTTGATGATMADELLDHYEQGTWTPTISYDSGSGDFVGNVASASGNYVRIGDLVWISGTITLTTARTSFGSHLGFSQIPFNGRHSSSGGIMRGVGSIEPLNYPSSFRTWRCTPAYTSFDASIYWTGESCTGFNFGAVYMA